MWNRYQVTMKFPGKLMGGVPKHPDIIKNWLEARAPRIAPPDGTPLDVLGEEVSTAMSAEDATETEKVWTGFMSDPVKGLYVPGSHLKAHLKNCANIVKEWLAKKNLKAKLADRLYIDDARLYLERREPHGYWEHPVHVMTMLGPRSALKRNDYVEGVTLQAHFRVLNDGVITEKILRSILEYGSIHGFGAERGLGHGRYEFTLDSLGEGETT